MESNDSFYQSRVPWSSEPSLKEITREVGVDFDRFIEGLKEEQSDSEMAEEFNVPEELIYHLRDHFYTHGVHSIVGQD
ncbi:MAG TPA: helix-turn-helix domain-containing protein [Bacillota bacterium]|jgi:DNA-directed RNA polymerase specialized sigma subunit|nr:helix-turn-helix domain-containing protein [Peptococcaceae bacterium MAG4]NLW39130.1 helix-turn-helix domain-containing protein [Peptococcaceae bacterium]HPZ42420.1 helix-turn-helix domain-containing protein [Bacillota bacterium]HQD75086.1 helix-turn-helix domain-containing protein [Bacillota bacterium]HUM57643.1 helix-turn-helix domain-containing protein [Bacillota bacterium]